METQELTLMSKLKHKDIDILCRGYKITSCYKAVFEDISCKLEPKTTVIVNVCS